MILADGKRRGAQRYGPATGGPGAGWVLRFQNGSVARWPDGAPRLPVKGAPVPATRYYAKFTAHGARLFERPGGAYVGTVPGDYSLTPEFLKAACYWDVGGYYTVRLRDDGELETADGPEAIRIP